MTENHLEEISSNSAVSSGSIPKDGLSWFPQGSRCSTHCVHRYPLGSRSNAVAIAQVFFVLERLLRHCRNSSSQCCCTERSLYYRDPQLFFGGQMAVQRCLRRLCSWLDVCRELQRDFEFHLLQTGEKCSDVAWWERRSLFSLWWEKPSARLYISRHLFTTSLPLPFLRQMQNALRSINDKQNAKRIREDQNEGKMHEGAGKTETRSAKHGINGRCQADFMSFPGFPSLSVSSSSPSVLGTCLQSILSTTRKEDGETLGYTREQIGVIANGKSILVGYLAFEVDDNDSRFSEGNFPMGRRGMHQPSSSSVFSGLAHGAQGMVLTSDVVLRCTGFRALSFCNGKEHFFPLPSSSKQREEVFPNSKRIRCSHYMAQDEVRGDDFSTLPSSPAPNLSPSLFTSDHVLVLVEKECVLRRLVDTDHALLPSSVLASHTLTNSDLYQWDRCKSSLPASCVSSSLHTVRPFIFLCTRGYPCVASRLFLRRLHAAWPSLPILALTDGDPHGIGIVLSMMGLSTVTSRRTAASANFHHTTSHISESVARETFISIDYSIDEQGHHHSQDACISSTPSSPSLLPLIWIGIRPSKLFHRYHPHLSHIVPSHTTLQMNTSAFTTNRAQGFLPTTPSDRKVLLRLQQAINSYLATLQLSPNPPTTCTDTPQHHFRHHTFHQRHYTAQPAHLRPSQCSQFTYSTFKDRHTPSHTIVYTLHALLKEMAWIDKNSLKCEIEAISPENPLAFLHRSISQLQKNNQLPHN